jgi:hypothetical protein
MTRYYLTMKLLSDATFGRGDGLAGEVDAEVQHDAAGFPYLGGRTLKGLLGAECAEIVDALRGALAAAGAAEPWAAAGQRLFGASGAGLDGAAGLRVGPAELPADLRAAVAAQVAADAARIPPGNFTPVQVLESLTAVRRQTAMDAETGAPKKNTLRAMRVIVRGEEFTAPLDLEGDPGPYDLPLLAASVKALRRAGTGRNRGRGKVQCVLKDADGKDVTDRHFAEFKKAVGA